MSPDDGQSAPVVRGILETVLYAEELGAIEAFYHGVLGLPIASARSQLGVGFRVSPESVLLFFAPSVSARPGRPLPSHGVSGPGHVALRIERSGYDTWRARLIAAGVEIEHEETWTDRPLGNGERSIYVRDPAGHSVELITGDIWGGAT